jgi:putative protein kinase ArgK-like GTPase of G3E family
MLAADLKLALSSHHDTSDWTPPIVLTSMRESGGIDQLSEAIDRHQTWISAVGGRDVAKDRRRVQHVGSLVTRRVNEVLRALPNDVLDQPIIELYRMVVAKLLQGCETKEHEAPAGMKNVCSIEANLMRE